MVTVAQVLQPPEASPDQSCLTVAGLCGALPDVMSARSHMKMMFQPPRRHPSKKEQDKRYFAVRQESQTNVSIYERKEVTLENERGLKLRCSHFVPCYTNERCRPRPCVVWCHGMCASRLEVQLLLPYLLCYDISVFSLDFSGSGQSEGDFISFGHFEQDDIKVALNYLRRKHYVSELGLWGFSMGAAAALIRAVDEEDVRVCVFDSAFADFQSVALQLARQHWPLMPQLVLSLAWDVIRSEAQNQIGFDLATLTPVTNARSGTCSALFIAATDDDVVPSEHSRRLHDAWGGEKSLHYIEGDHSAERPATALLHASKFLCERLGAETNWFPNRWIRKAALVFEVDTAVAQKHIACDRHEYNVSV